MLTADWFWLFPDLLFQLSQGLLPLKRVACLTPRALIGFYFRFPLQNTVRNLL